jgi:GWxTD domain-containing protein
LSIFMKLILTIFICLQTTLLWSQEARDPVRSRAFSELAAKAWRTRDHRLAYAHALDALRFDANNIEANLLAARFAIAEMLGPQEWGTTLEKAGGDIQAYVEDRADEAVERLSDILVLKPDHVAAQLLLGMVLYENEMFHRLVGLFENYRRGNPDSAEPYFMLSLALNAQGDDEHARIAFAHGLNRLEGEDRYLRAGFLFHEAVAQNAASLKRTWAPEDPLYLTNTNERLMEHFHRVAYANLRFSEDDEMRGGWESDRGKVYIRYGAPAERFISASSVGPDQLWSYEDFSVAFMRLRASPWTYRNGIIGRTEFRTMADLAKSFPPASHVAKQWTQFPLSCRLVQFKGEGQTARVDINLTFRDRRIDSKKGPKGARKVDVDLGILALDSNWRVIERTDSQLDHLVWLKGDTEGGYFVKSDFLELAPGLVQIHAECLDRVSSIIGVFHDTLQVRIFGGNELAISDIAINRRSIRRPGSVGRAGRVFLHAPERTGSIGKTLEVYAEVYNLGVFEAPDSSRFTVQFAVRPSEDPNGWAVISSEVNRGVSRSESLDLKLGLAKTAPGPKVLRLRVTDQARAETIEATTDFRVTW